MQTRQEIIKLKYFRLQYNDGTFEIVKTRDCMEVIKQYDLCTKKHINTRIVELSGEQEAIAQANEV